MSNENDNVRLATDQDLEALRTLVESTLFPSALLDNLIAPFLASASDSHHELWLVYERQSVLEVAYCTPEPFTDNSRNLKSNWGSTQRTAHWNRAGTPSAGGALHKRSQRTATTD